ncbi:complex I NDUFA9 subunit family protein [Ketogulonicigenium vulgare]|uniref:complex I NDUFA9 subunit family protein n=1 Tax=Ketogulonicigenium vulgare TaxID=92945 RepID=UPI002359E283|nr:complex I NDUFA9 subunit family protein [Ketogulonicigenium vulgare]
MSGIVTVFGASGFLGRYVVRRLAQAGWRVRAAVRDPNLALFLRPYGAVGQVEPVACNIRDAASVARVLDGADAAINCIGILTELRANTFDSVHHLGAALIARTARAAGVQWLVHVSALGAGGQGSAYFDSKAAGEAAVMAAFPSAVVVQPAVMFGRDDHFFNRLAGLARLPVLPIVGGDVKMQPVWVDDVAAAIVTALAPDFAAGTYPLAGPEVMTMQQIAQQVLQVTRRSTRIVDLPLGLARFAAGLAEFGHRASFSILPVPLSRDQIAMLSYTHHMPDGSGFQPFGITPAPTGVVLPDYLWRFRPAGQFTAIRESAAKLRDAKGAD